MARWAVEALRGLDLGDARRARRLVDLVGRLAANVGESLPQACGSWAAAKAAYRFFDNDQVDPEAIREALALACAERASQQSRILAVEDTTSLDFTAHRAVAGAGPLESSHCQGLFCHTVLALTPAGVPLGVLGQQVWARDPAERGKKHTRKSKPIEAKESYRWLVAERQALARLPAEVEVVTIADAEGDIYEWFIEPRRPGADFIIRAAQVTRCCRGEPRHLLAAVQAAPLQERGTLELVATPRRAARTARVELRVAPVTLLPPARAGGSPLPPVTLQAVLVEEGDPPQGTEPVCWLLLTSLPVATAAQARTVVAWYRLRWLVERYHYVLKSGCGFERLQLETAARLERALATYQTVAWGVLWVTYQGRAAPEAPCTVAFGEEEWQALWQFQHPEQPLPDRPPALGPTLREVARLGGWLGRKGDGEPGLKVLWRGLARLDDITTAWLLFRPPAGRDHDVGKA